MGALRTWSGWKHSSHKLVSLCVGASHRGSKSSPEFYVLAGLMDEIAKPQPPIESPPGEYVVIARRYSTISLSRLASAIAKSPAHSHASAMTKCSSRVNFSNA